MGNIANVRIRGGNSRFLFAIYVFNARVKESSMFSFRWYHFFCPIVLSILFIYLAVCTAHRICYRRNSHFFDTQILIQSTMGVYYVDVQKPDAQKPHLATKLKKHTETIAIVRGDHIFAAQYFVSTWFTSYASKNAKTQANKKWVCK